MDGQAIAGQALGFAGLGMLNRDFGRTRLAGTMSARRDAGAARPEADGAARATRP